MILSLPSRERHPKECYLSKSRLASSMSGCSKALAYVSKTDVSRIQAKIKPWGTKG
jgi:hypothetical protein